MPRASIWLIRMALLHLLSGALLGAIYLAWKATGTGGWVVSHRPVHVEQMLVGFMVQFIFGVGYWILPRTEAAERTRTGPLIWAVFGLINLGVLLVAGTAAHPEWQAVTFAGRMCETAAVVLFVLHAWHRQRPYTPKAKRALM